MNYSKSAHKKKPICRPLAWKAVAKRELGQESGLYPIVEPATWSVEVTSLVAAKVIVEQNSWNASFPPGGYSFPEQLSVGTRT